MRRISVLGLLANAAALALLGLTGVALAGPALPATLTGTILPGLDSSSSLMSGFLDTLSPISLPSGSLLYPIFSLITSIISGVVTTSSELIGYLLSTDLSSLGLPSGTSSGGGVPIYTVSGSSAYIATELLFQPGPSASIPEPNGIAVVVTAVAGLATLLRRRKLRRGQG
jgi:hypothetical protein